MRRYQHAERMIRGITWQGKKELYAVLLRDLKRTDKTVQAQHLDALKDKDIIMAEVKAQYYPEGEAHAQA